VEGSVRSDKLPARADVTDATTGDVIARVDDLLSFPVHLPPYGSLFLLLQPEADTE
jgi:hypothetical protein